MIYLIISEPSLLLKSKLKEITSKALSEINDFNYLQLDFEANSLDEILDTLESPAFGSDKKVVVVKSPYFIKDEKAKVPFENDLSKLLKYINDENKDTEFIILCNKDYFSGNSNKYVNAIKNKGEIINLELEDANEFNKYVKQLVNLAKIDLTSGALEILCERCIGDVCKLEREIAKLACYHDKIDADLANKMIARPFEDNVFELANALLRKDKKKVMTIYNDLKLLKVEPINLVALLGTQFRFLLQVLVLRNEGKSRDEIATILNANPYRIKKSLEISINYSLDDVKNILVDLANLDVKIKTGEADRYVDFELFIATR